MYTLRKYYTGIGSRQTPDDVQEWMSEFARKARRDYWVLRSGGASGADKAFEIGLGITGSREIYLPWRGFDSKFRHVGQEFYGATAKAFDIARTIHPGWGHMKPTSRLLHARNIHQVLGLDCATPSKFLICWTPGGKDIGGSRTAIICARKHDIPVFNIFDRVY